MNISFAGVEGESLIMAIKDMAVSSGSACTSASLEPSYILRAIGVEEELAHTIKPDDTTTAQTEATDATAKKDKKDKK